MTVTSGPARLPVWRAVVSATALVWGTFVIGAAADADEAPPETTMTQAEPDQVLPVSEVPLGDASADAPLIDEPAGADDTSTTPDTTAPEDPTALEDVTAPVGAASDAQVDPEQETQVTQPPDGTAPEQQTLPPDGQTPPVTQHETEEAVEADTPTEPQLAAEEPPAEAAEPHDSTHDDSAHDDSAHDDHGGGETGFRFTVNGQSSRGGTSPHLQGCSLTVVTTVTTGADDGETHEVTVSVVPAGEGTGTYVSGTPALGDDGHAITFEMTDILSEVEIHKNGYHLAVVVDVDGSQSKSSPFWLACGASGEGSPTLLTFVVNWVPVAGQDAAADLSEFKLHASTDKGSALCTYPEKGGSLVCVYTNRGGHAGESDALVMPGGEKHEFRVSVEKVPRGWEVNEATVGTFLGRSICGHHEAPGGTPCGHTVEVKGVAVTEATTTTTTAPPATTSAPETSSTSETTADPDVAGPTTQSTTTSAEELDTSLDGEGSLPVTGAATPLVLYIALGLLGCGMSLLALSLRASRQ